MLEEVLAVIFLMRFKHSLIFDFLTHLGQYKAQNMNNFLLFAHYKQGPTSDPHGKLRTGCVEKEGRVERKKNTHFGLLKKK